LERICRIFSFDANTLDVVGERTGPHIVTNDKIYFV
jgi:hypothetical protein